MKQSVSISYRAAVSALLSRFADMIDHIPEEECARVCIVLSDAIKSGFTKHAREQEQMEELQNMPTDQLIKLVSSRKRVREEEEDEEPKHGPDLWTPHSHYLVTAILEHTHYGTKAALRLLARMKGSGGGKAVVEFIATASEIAELDNLEISPDYIKKANKRIMEPFLVYFTMHPIEDHISLFTSSTWGRTFLRTLRERTMPESILKNLK